MISDLFTYTQILSPKEPYLIIVFNTINVAIISLELYLGIKINIVFVSFCLSIMNM